jgi:crotonobetainyl-CoA:carnitine CoA-transferase CaiB-like acyl-CoA transferase
MADIFQDPHFMSRESIVRVPHDALGLVALTSAYATFVYDSG